MTVRTSSPLMFANCLLLLQEQTAAFRWTYVWLAVSGLVLTLVVLAFAYLLVKRHWERLSRIVEHPVVQLGEKVLARFFPRFWGFIRARFSLREWRGLALTVSVVLLFSAAFLFAMITESWISEEELYAFDQRIYSWLVDALGASVLSFIRVITWAGDLVTVTILSLIVAGFLLYRRHKWRVVELTLAVGGGAAVMWGLKLIFSRARPDKQLATAAGHSFPSGHSFMAMTFYGFLIYLMWRFVRRDAVRIAMTVLLVLLICAVGISRVILRVHWVSDVAAGIAAGLGWLVCSIIIAHAIRMYRGSDPSVAVR